MPDIKYKVNNNWTNAALAIYKVGAIYMSVNSTSPATLFGGTWVALEGRMLIGANSTYTAGSTGGSKTTTLATANLPAHAHTVPAHNHGLNGHTHSYNAPNGTGGTSITAAQLPVNYASFLIRGDATWGGTNTSADNNGDSGYDRINHTGASTGNRVKINFSGSGQAHSHTTNTTSANTGGNSGNTANKAAFNTNNTGSGTAFNTISPYLAVYMWKRTA